MRQLLDNGILTEDSYPKQGIALSLFAPYLIISHWNVLHHVYVQKFIDQSVQSVIILL